MSGVEHRRGEGRPDSEKDGSPRTGIGGSSQGVTAC